jgi:hypothetical protein
MAINAQRLTSIKLQMKNKRILFPINLNQQSISEDLNVAGVVAVRSVANVFCFKYYLFRR